MTGGAKLLLTVGLVLAGLAQAHAQGAAPGGAVPAAPSPASVDAPSVAAAAPSPHGAVAPPALGPYSLPWQLRPVTVANVLRSDTSIARYDSGSGAGSTVATTLLGSYATTPNLALLVRLGFVQNGPPASAPDGAALNNPVIGAMYARTITRGFRAAGFGGVTVPIGTGGGSAPDAAAAAANSGGIAARSAMDNAMFAVNYLAAMLGGGLAYVDHQLTVQAELTLCQLVRGKGSDQTAISSDPARTNATMGLHAGYFVASVLSLGAEVRYQRWLSTPTRISMGARSDVPAAVMDTATVAIGPRFHFKLGTTWLRPGVSYTQALDSPLSDSHYKTIQIDVPFVF